MKARSLVIVPLAAVMVGGLAIAGWAQLPSYSMTTFIPHQITTPDKVDTMDCGQLHRPSFPWAA